MKIVEPKYKFFIDISEGGIKDPHAYAARSIRVGRKFPQSEKTLNAYINDAIGFHMIPEVGLYYSENCYGVADAIDFTNNFLRIHALRTKHEPSDMKQLLIYDALFCLKHDIKPCDILIANPTFEEINTVIEKIKEFDRVVREVKLGETT